MIAGCNSVLHIIELIAQVQVSRIDATAVVTEMIYLSALGNLSIAHFPRCAMGQAGPAIFHGNEPSMP